MFLRSGSSAGSEIGYIVDSWLIQLYYIACVIRQSLLPRQTSAGKACVRRLRQYYVSFANLVLGVHILLLAGEALGGQHIVQKQSIVAQQSIKSCRLGVFG